MEKQHHHDHQGGGFMNGFLLGAIIGAAVVFFLFTEKGKKLLKTISEEGIEGFADLKDLVQEEMYENEEEYESSYDESSNDREYEEPERLKPIPHHTDHSHVEPIHHHESSPVSSKAKRFFRGIKRG